MRIVLNRGTNVTDDEVRRYRFHLLPQKIVVDGTAHDTRGVVRDADVDAWVKSAKVHPYVLGTSAAEMVEVYRRLATTDHELLAIMVAKHLSGSYASASSAARTFVKMAGHANAVVEVVDTNAADVGAGLAAVLAAEAARAGLPFERVVRLTEKFCQTGQTIFVPRDLSYLVKGGRASFLKVAVANLLDRSPLLGIVDHEVAQVGTVKRDEIVEGIAQTLVNRIGAGSPASLKSRPVWIGVLHGGDEPSAQRLAALLQKHFSAAYCTIRPLSSSIYLHVGPRGLGAFVGPIDELDWTPPKPS